MTPNTYRVDITQVGGVVEVGIVCGTWRMPNVIRIETVGFFDRLVGKTKADLINSAIVHQTKKAERLNWWNRAVDEYGVKANASVGED